METEVELLGKLFGQGAPAKRSHSGFTGVHRLELSWGNTAQCSCHQSNQCNMPYSYKYKTEGEFLGKLLVELGVPAYRSHSGFTGVHRLVGRAWLGKHCSVIMPPLKPMPNTYKYKYKQKNIKQPRNCKTKYIQTNLMWSIG